MTTVCSRCQDFREYYRMIMQSGGVAITERCPTCGSFPAGKPFASKALVKDVDALPLWEDRTINAPSCEYEGCKNKGVEYHHYAPRHLFEDADKWRTGWLCLEHHRQWHKQTKTGAYKK